MKVRFMKSKLPIPFFFAVHTWTVIEEIDKKERWEVFHKKNRKETGHIYKDLFEPESGLNIFPWKRHPRWKPKEIFSVEGKNAEKVAKFIRKRSTEYPQKDRYILWPGPNSNTFTRWLIDQFPEIKNKLPWNAFGKRYNI